MAEKGSATRRLARKSSPLDASERAIIPFPQRRSQPEKTPHEANNFPSDAELVHRLIREFNLITPFLTLRSSTIDQVSDYFGRHLPFVKLFYAMKSNPTPALLRYLLSKGLGVDVASTSELMLALKCGATRERIVVSNPFKDESLLHGMFTHKIHAFAADSAGELIKVARYRDKNFPTIKECRPIIRVLVPAQGVEIDLGKKFGCTSQEAVNLIRLANDLEIPPLGISFHVGTQCIHPESYGWAVDICSKIRFDVSRQLGYELEVLNIGGGYCSPDHARKNGISFEEYFDQLANILTPLAFERPKNGESQIKLWAEPGRIFSSGSGIAVCQVLGKTDRPDGPAIYLNDGIYGCFSTRLVEKCEYEFSCIPQSESKTFSKLIPYTVFGPTCDSIDVLSHAALLPSNLEVGDYIFASGTGAYSISTACSFNGFNPPPVFFASEGEEGALSLLNQEGELLRESAGRGKSEAANS